MDEQLKLYSVADVAKLWHIEQSKIRKLIQIGEIRAIKFSKQGLKITAKELQRFLDENENNDFSNLLDCQQVMQMQQSYYKYDTRALMFKYGTPEHKFYDYLIKKENYSRLKGLPIGQVELTIRTVSKDIGITEKVARRLINQFIENGLIKLVNKNPKGSKKPSTYVLKTYEEKGTEKDMDGADERAQNNENITSLESDKGHRKDTVKGTEKGTSKIDNINRIKNNNIYTSKFDELWKLYPNKKGKSDAKKNVIK